MTVEEFNRDFQRRMQEIKEYVEGEDIRHMMGKEAVDHFKDSFANEGFTDEVLEKWDDVERRDEKSAWYGHSGQMGKFSSARTTAKILTGETSELQDSMYYETTPRGAKITNATVYAWVHQFGLQAKIYGKKAFQMIARPFMGKSKKLKANIEGNISDQLKEILTR